MVYLIVNIYKLIFPQKYQKFDPRSLNRRPSEVPVYNLKMTVFIIGISLIGQENPGRR